MSRSPGGIPSRLLQIADRFAVISSLLRESARASSASTSLARSLLALLQALSDSLMKSAAATFRDSLVHYFLIERMQEFVARRRRSVSPFRYTAGFAQIYPAGLSRRPSGLDLSNIIFDPRCHRCHRDLYATGAGDLQDLPLCRREVIKTNVRSFAGASVACSLRSLDVLTSPVRVESSVIVTMKRVLPSVRQWMSRASYRRSTGAESSPWSSPTLAGGEDLSSGASSASSTISSSLSSRSDSSSQCLCNCSSCVAARLAGAHWLTASTGRSVPSTSSRVGWRRHALIESNSRVGGIAPVQVFQHQRRGGRFARRGFQCFRHLAQHAFACGPLESSAGGCRGPLD